MNRRRALLLTLLLGLGSAWFLHRAAATAAWKTKVDSWVLETAAAQETTQFLVHLAAQADLSAAAGLADKTARGEYVYRQLTAVAQQSQPPILDLLARHGVPYRRYWVANMIWVEADTAVLQELAQHPAVDYIYANPSVSLALPPVPEQPVGPTESAEAPWNITLINAPALWDAGVTGQGVVVGGQDTGYQWDHPGLIRQYRGWDGVTANHDYHWHDAIHSGGGVCGPDSAVPCDDNGHGTHTMGTMVGNDLPPSDPDWPAGAPHPVGVAPGAQWIGCRNMDQGVGTPATYSECYEWFIAPYPIGGDPFNDGEPALAPHVINNSWSCPVSEGCDEPEVLLEVVQRVRDAGIVTVHSAGNSGPGCSSVNAPAAIYDESFSVAATTSSDNIASFSSRGPVTVDGSNRLKPDVAAPGVNVNSTTRGGGYGLSSGTSMAAPHVAGLVALTIAADPGLAGQVDVIEQRIRQTAVPLTTTDDCGGDTTTSLPNHTFGYGRVLAEPSIGLDSAGDCQANLCLQKTAARTTVDISDTLTYTLSVHNYASDIPYTQLVLTDSIPTGARFLTATGASTWDGTTVRWERPSLDAGTNWQVDLTVIISGYNGGIISNEAYGVRSDELTAVLLGSPVTTTVLPTHRTYLPLLRNE